MDTAPSKNPLPEKVLRRHFELAKDLLPYISRLVTQDGRPADTLLNHYLRSRRELGSRDRRFLSQAIFSYFRWYGWTVGKLEMEPVEASLTGVLLDCTELHPSFQYMKTQCDLPAEMVPLGGRSLSDKCSALTAWFRSSPGALPLTPRDLLPPEFEDLVDPDFSERCLVQFQQRPPTWIRARTDAAVFRKILADHEIAHRRDDRIGCAFAVEGGTSLAGMRNDVSGQFVVQDIGSQCVGLLCNPSAGEEWWDCCAGAGGKALHLMDLMEQNGKALATDIRNESLKELKKRARRYGIRKIRTHPFNAASDEPFTKTFDGVLADAPCSGWGTWGRNPDARWRTSKQEVSRCARRQLKILNNVKWCVKPGGILVYAVCTLTRPETEEVVMNFLDQHENFRLDPFLHPLTGAETDGQLQIWPWEGPGDAMFIARFRRAAD